MNADVNVDFIRRELQTGITMLNLARTEREVPDPEAAFRAITNARKALDGAKRFLPTLDNVGEGTRSDLRRGITELEKAIHHYDNAP